MVCVCVCVCVCVWMLIQTCPTLCNLMDCISTVSSIHGVLQKEYWNKLSFPSPGKGSNSHLLHLWNWRQLLHHCTTWQPIPILCIYLYARVCIKLENSGFICTATFSICYLFSFLANFLAFRLKSNRMGKTRDQFKKIRDAKRIFHAKMGTTRIKMVWTWQRKKILRRGDKNTKRIST